MLGTTLKTPLSSTELSSNTKDNISIELDKKSGCTRYMAGVMKGVKVGPSPNG